LGRKVISIRKEQICFNNWFIRPKDALCLVKNGWIEATTKIRGTRKGTIARAIEKNSWKNNSIVKLTWSTRINSKENFCCEGITYNQGTHGMSFKTTKIWSNMEQQLEVIEKIKVEKDMFNEQSNKEDIKY
jgi:hypothetical protein